jgi:hypothetical protein
VYTFCRSRHFIDLDFFAKRNEIVCPPTTVLCPLNCHYACKSSLLLLYNYSFRQTLKYSINYLTNSRLGKGIFGEMPRHRFNGSCRKKLAKHGKLRMSEDFWKNDRIQANPIRGTGIFLGAKYQNGKTVPK